jgi:ABC-type sugar transport system substrate-binding protein
LVLVESLAALRTLAEGGVDAALAKLPVIGMDGLPEGRSMVDSGVLAATTRLAVSSEAAVQLAAAYLVQASCHRERCF